MEPKVACSNTESDDSLPPGLGLRSNERNLPEYPDSKHNQSYERIAKPFVQEFSRKNLMQDFENIHDRSHSQIQRSRSSSSFKSAASGSPENHVNGRISAQPPELLLECPPGLLPTNFVNDSFIQQFQHQASIDCPHNATIGITCEKRSSKEIVSRFNNITRYVQVNNTVPHIPDAKDHKKFPESSDQEETTCIICLQPLRDYVAITECDHSVACCSCVIRLRVISKDLRCPVCQQPSPVVIIDKLASAKRFSSYKNSASLSYDPISAASFTDRKQLTIMQPKWSKHCMLCSRKDRQKFSSLDKLKQHLRVQHGRAFCDLCLANKAVFLQEQIVYTPEDLEHHLVEDITSCGHKKCGLCTDHFYSSTEFVSHLYRSHYHCHICKPTPTRHREFYAAYRDLEKHFRTAHWPCLEGSCVKQLFVVFETMKEWQDHMTETHKSPNARFTMPHLKTSTQPRRILVHTNESTDDSIPVRRPVATPPVIMPPAETLTLDHFPDLTSGRVDPSASNTRNRAKKTTSTTPTWGPKLNRSAINTERSKCPHPSGGPNPPFHTSYSSAYPSLSSTRPSTSSNTIRPKTNPIGFSILDNNRTTRTKRKPKIPLTKNEPLSSFANSRAVFCSLAQPESSGDETAPR